MRTTTALLLTGLLAASAAACGDDDAATSDAVTTTTSDEPAAAADLVIDIGDALPPTLEPTDVVDVIDNPFFPLAPGDRWVYEGVVDGLEERVEVEVLSETRQVMGIDAVVVRDQAFEDGELVEDTHDWFAQDADGNVWYLGEETSEIEDGEIVSTSGSWEAGVDGALPGIVMLADPHVGDIYRQEYDAGEAEDAAEVVDVDGDRLVVREQNPLDPEAVEEKIYERGVGLVEEVVTRGGEGGLRLVDQP